MFDDDEMEHKFDDCPECLHRNFPTQCATCDAGENFEEEEPEGLDVIFARGV